MRELSLDQLRTLVAIIELGSFSAAARALHLAQPTVSLHSSELEARLATPLIVRGGRRMIPARRREPARDSPPRCSEPGGRRCLQPSGG